jgi:superoxide dismutase, Cu-Zn family
MRPRHALPILAVAAAAACSPTYTTGGSTGANPAPSTSTSGDMAGMTRYSANLAAMNGSTVHGTASVHSMTAGQQTVDLQISGGTAGATYPWHIHTGSCADGMTPIVGSPQLYTALGTSGDGTASLSANIPVTLDPAQRYHVNVHASPTDMGTIVACGDLTR